jgi:hypothetical protein
MISLVLDFLCVLASISLTAATEQASPTHASTIRYKSVSYFTNWVTYTNTIFKQKIL